MKTWLVIIIAAMVVICGCVGVDGEPLVLPEPADEPSAVESCMFTIWFFTAPDEPPVDVAAGICTAMVEDMDHVDYELVMDEIRDAIERFDGPVLDEPVDCEWGKCI